MTVRGAQQGFTSFLVNFGEWSFLSSIMIVAVAVPVNPTSSPAISWASMISSYLGFSSVYEAKTQQRGRHLDWSHCSGQVAGLCSASAVCPLCQGRHLRRPALSPVVDKHTFGVSPSRTVLIHGLELAVGMESIFCPCLRGHVIHSIMFQVQGLGTYWTFDVYIHHMSFHSGLMELIQNEAKSDDEIRTKITALGTEESGPGIRSLCFSETSISLFNQHVKLHLLFPLYRWENTNWGLESFILHFLHATVSCFSLLYHVKFERCFLIQLWSDKFNTKAILHCYPSIHMYFIWIFDRYFAIMFKHSQLIQGSVGRWVWSAPIGRMPEIWDYADCNSPLDSVTHPGVYSGGSSWHWSQPESIFGLLAVKGNCGENSFTCLPNLISFWLWGGFPGDASSKEPGCQCRRCKTLGFDPWVRKILWRRKWRHPFQYSCLENPTDRQARWAMVHRVAMSKTRSKRLSTHTQLDLTNYVTDSGQWNVGRSDGLIWPLKLPHNPLCFLFPIRKKPGSDRYVTVVQRLFTDML